MKATKKQIAEVTAIATEMDHSVILALHTLNTCSTSIYKAIGAKGVVESSIRANSEHFVDTLSLAKLANKLGVSINSLMTNEQIAVNCKY